MAVPTMESGPALDNLQDLLRRKRELEKNKRKFRLTEADCNLLLTNANEFTFKDGQIIAQNGDTLSSVFRVKTGKVLFMKENNVLCELGQGWFLGETILLNGQGWVGSDGCYLVAHGKVTLLEMNLNFVRKLFEVDRTLALKFYHHIASKLSVIFTSLLENPTPKRLAARTLSASSLASISTASSSITSNASSCISSAVSSISSTSSTSSASSAPDSMPSPPSPSFSSSDFSTSRRRLTKRQSSMIIRTPYKVYTLDHSKSSVRTALIKSNKIEIKSERLGLSFKTKILFSQITNFVRTSENSVTILFESYKAKTLFFKDATALEELYAILQSLVETFARPAQKSNPSTPISSPLISNSPKNAQGEGVPTLEDVQLKMDKEILSYRGVRKQLKKGDVLIEEGDLYQRVYIVNEGTLASTKNGCTLQTLRAGESFGIMTLLNLRPYNTTITVTSETAEVSVIPAFKINELINSDVDLAVRIFTKAGLVLQKQIEQFVADKSCCDNVI